MNNRTSEDVERVAIIGACGHVGLPLALVVAEAGYEVVGIDRDAARVRQVQAGQMPYVEADAGPLLSRLLAEGRLCFQTGCHAVRDSDVVVIVIGTPVDENLNARIDPLMDLLGEIKPYLHAGQLIVLRSTVMPGTTELFKEQLQEHTCLVEGWDLSIVFAPERVLQGMAIEEIGALPQLIGAFNDRGFDRAERFFSRFVHNRLLRLAPIEAEIGKLITNMARYVSFALANEFYLIADTFQANAHKIIEACNLDYPRLDIPRPGPNVGGPCLYKDGHYLLTRVPFPGLISTAFRINESMPMTIVRKVLKHHVPKKVGVLGMTFKANCDDTRNSLSFKLRKLLRNERCRVVEVDPYLPEFEDMSRLKGVDTLILMTPHDTFADLAELLRIVDNPGCLIVDLWSFWSENTDLSHDGMYLAEQAATRYETGRHGHEDSRDRFGRLTDAGGDPAPADRGTSDRGRGQLLPLRPVGAST